MLKEEEEYKKYRNNNKIMGSNSSHFSDDEWCYVPFIGLQGTFDFRAVGLPSEVPQQVREKYSNFPNDLWVNVVLKTLEGTAKLQQNLISSALLDNLFKPLLIPVKKALQPVKDQLNPDKSGASYLLGVNGVVTIGHGSSNSEAVKNAIIYTETAVKKDLISKFSSALSEL